LVKIYLRDTGERFNTPCLPQKADVSLVFKAPPDYEIKDDATYWSVVENDVVPAVLAACRVLLPIGMQSSVQIDNYVDDFKISSVRMRAQPGGSETPWAVIRAADRLPGYGGGEFIEQPLSRACLCLQRTRSFDFQTRYKTISALAAGTLGNILRHVDDYTPPVQMTKEERDSFVGGLFLLLGAAYFYNAVMSAESATPADKERAKFFAGQECSVRGKIFNPGTGSCY
jgi:hypothetical protein